MRRELPKKPNNKKRTQRSMPALHLSVFKMRVCLVCLIGLPACGKTTFAKALQHHFLNEFIVEHLEYDKVVEWNGEVVWKEERNKVFHRAVHLIESSFTQDGNGLVIILDDNMYYRSMRYEFYKLAKKYGLCYGQVLLKANLETAVLVDSQREEGKVGESVVAKMFKNLEEPIQSWEKNTLTLEAYSSFDKVAVKDFILKTFEMPLEAAEASVWKREEPSMLHMVDLALRSIVGHCIKEASMSSKMDFKRFSASVLSKRKEVFEGIKSGKIQIPQSVQEEKDYFVFLLPLFK